MRIPDGAHTHGHSGGSGLGTAVLVVIGAALAVNSPGRSWTPPPNCSAFC